MKSTDLESIFDFYGTDKNRSGYTATYKELFEPIRNTCKAVLEIGIGTMDRSVVSSFAGNLSLFPHYLPGGSLRSWRDYFPGAQITGVDIASDCMFTEERIRTVMGDSSGLGILGLLDKQYDVIIDDGNHNPKYQMATLRNLKNLLSPNGIYVIEDINGYGGEDGYMDAYRDELSELTKGMEVSDRGNHIVIKNAQTASMDIPATNSNPRLTVVTGLWNIGRDERDFESHYLVKFRQLLKAPCSMFVFIEAKYEHVVWEIRRKENTQVRIYELSDIKNLYNPFWDRTQEIRTSKEWLNITGEGGWLTGSPQARLEWYNPIVQSKMFMMHDVTLWNPFDSKYFLWVDGGLTNTVPEQLLCEPEFYRKVTKYIDPFLFLSFDYSNTTAEIHGMKREKVHQYAGTVVDHVCRGGLFGGTKRAIGYAHSQYYGLLDMSLSDKVMGTEETIFAIMSYLRPNYFRRYRLPGTIISPFLEAVINDNAVITGENVLNKEYHELRDRTAIYFLAFQKPNQLDTTISHMQKTCPDWLTVPLKYVVDNSTDPEARAGIAEVCKKHGFKHIPLMENLGINGARQYVAEHFDKLDADYYVFFEDDMTLNGEDMKGEFCRNGFRRYVPKLWDVIHGIMAKEELDFLKLTFTEVFMDNQVQVSWYNVEQDVRDDQWPYYNKLPVHGFDLNHPATKFDYLGNFDGTAYAIGDVYYCNWPLLFSKAGNKKVFLTWIPEHPHERTQMAYVFGLQIRGEIKAGVLLASPITHDRKEAYAADERKEG